MWSAFEEEEHDQDDNVDNAYIMIIINTDII